jgi:DNA-binding IclR family transcriptional regulator
VFDWHNVVLIASIAGQADTGNQAIPGSRFPAHASALGQAILAYSTDEVQRTAASSAPATLPGELVEVRRVGVASKYEDAATGVVCVASPIRVAGEKPAAAIAVAGPAGAIDARRVGGLVRSAATALGQQWSTHAPS